MKNRINRILLCLTLLFVMILTGCTNQEYELIVNDDNTAKLTVHYTVDVDTYELLSVYGIETNYNFEKSDSSVNPIERCDALFQETATVFYNYGFEISPVNDAVEIGFEAIKNYPNIEKLNEDIPQLYEDGLIGLNGQITVEDSLINKVYTFSGTVKFMEDPDMDITPQEEAQVLEVYDTSNVKARVSLKMPGDLVAHDGVVESGLARYDTTYDSGQEIPVHLRTKVTNKLIQNLIYVAIFIVIVIVVIFVARKAKIKKEKKKMRDLYGDDDDDDV